MSVLTSSCGKDDCDFTVVFSRSAVGFKEGECWLGVARWKKVKQDYGRINVTACLCFFDNVAVDGDKRMGLVFHCNQFTSCVRGSLCTTSVWDRLRVAFFFILCVCLYGSCYCCAISIGLNMVYVHVYLGINGLTDVACRNTVKNVSFFCCSVASVREGIWGIRDILLFISFVCPCALIS